MNPWQMVSEEMNALDPTVQASVNKDGVLTYTMGAQEHKSQMYGRMWDSQQAKYDAYVACGRTQGCPRFDGARVRISKAEIHQRDIPLDDLAKEILSRTMLVVISQAMGPDLVDLRKKWGVAKGIMTVNPSMGQAKVTHRRHDTLYREGKVHLKKDGYDFISGDMYSRDSWQSFIPLGGLPTRDTYFGVLDWMEQTHQQLLTLEGLRKETAARLSQWIEQEIPGVLPGQGQLWEDSLTFAIAREGTTHSVFVRTDDPNAPDTWKRDLPNALFEEIRTALAPLTLSKLRGYSATKQARLEHKVTEEQHMDVGVDLV